MREELMSHLNMAMRVEGEIRESEKQIKQQQQGQEMKVVNHGETLKKHGKEIVKDKNLFPGVVSLC